MKDECLLCGAPLEYLEEAIPMECAVCHKIEPSRTRCVQGHYVCDDCHTRGMDRILSLCLASSSRDPLALLEEMMALPFCHMHGPEHHVMVGAALLTACKNAGADLDLPAALTEMYSRGKAVPGGVCGFWGACGAGVSTGIFLSILTGANPLAGKPWSLANAMTARSLETISRHGGPRCCKRNAALAIGEAVAFVREHLGVEMVSRPFSCTYSGKNNQCRKGDCLFHRKEA